MHFPLKPSLDYEMLKICLEKRKRSVECFKSQISCRNVLKIYKYV